MLGTVSHVSNVAHDPFFSDYYVHVCFNKLSVIVNDVNVYVVDDFKCRLGLIVSVNLNLLVINKFMYKYVYIIYLYSNLKILR